MKLRDLIFHICECSGEADCDNLIVSTNRDFFYCILYGKPITKKVLEKCWNDEMNELRYCLECKAFIHVDDIEGDECPFCGSINLRKAKSFKEEWECKRGR